MKNFILLGLLLLAVGARAEPSAKSISKRALADMVANYQLSKLEQSEKQQEFGSFGSGDFEKNFCDDTKAGSCVESVCKRVSCSYRPDLLEVAKSCSGNLDGGCVEQACAKVSCSYRPEVLNIVKACSGNYGGSCVKAACNNVSCSYRPDMLNIISACKNADGGCVEAVCSKASCSYRPDLLNVIKACAGADEDSARVKAVVIN